MLFLRCNSCSFLNYGRTESEYDQCSMICVLLKFVYLQEVSRFIEFVRTSYDSYILRLVHIQDVSILAFLAIVSMLPYQSRLFFISQRDW